MIKKIKLDANKAFSGFYILFAIAMVLFHMNYTQDWGAVASALLMPLFLLIPPVFYKIFGLKPVKELNLCIYVYSFIAFGLGVAARLYRVTAFYDKFVHFLAGYSFAILGLIVFYLIKQDKVIEKDKDFLTVLFFIWSFSLMIGVVWEIYEYAGDVLFGLNSQRTLETGIHDTMQDLIACTLGAGASVACTAFYYKRNVKAPLFHTFEQFFAANIGPVTSEEPDEGCNGLENIEQELLIDTKG